MPNPITGNAEFPIKEVLDLISDAVSKYPLPSMFELAERGHRSLFEQIVGCIISIRTLEETSLPASLRLFALATTPEQMAALPVEEIDRAIGDATFHERKAEQIQTIARLAVEEHDRTVPCNLEVVLGLPGVGPKCAALAMGISCGLPAIPVDIHVHRITNRWGYVATSTPERTMLALESVMPTDRWPEINRLLVPFGKHICTRLRPRCSTCPVSGPCQQVGVTDHR